jgi:hypothetical protein
VAQPGATAIDQRGDHDGYVCPMLVPGNAANATGAPFNAIDNRVHSSRRWTRCRASYANEH